MPSFPAADSRPPRWRRFSPTAKCIPWTCSRSPRFATESRSTRAGRRFRRSISTENSSAVPTSSGSFMRPGSWKSWFWARRKPTEQPAMGADSADEKTQRIISARLKLRQRYFDKIRGSPAASDAQPLGLGTPNPHGMPKLPVGQHPTENWPVLDLGVHPTVSRQQWTLRVDGSVEEPLTLDWEAFQALPQVEDTSDFHCVTPWRLMESDWKGGLVSTWVVLAG